LFLNWELELGNDTMSKSWSKEQEQGFKAEQEVGA